MSGADLTLQVVSLALTFLQAKGRYDAAVAKITALLTRVQAEGRTVTAEEWAALEADDDVARARLEAEIAAAT